MSPANSSASEKIFLAVLSRVILQELLCRFVSYSAPSHRGDQACLPCGALSIRHTERASLLDPSTILLRGPACILSKGASGVPLVTSVIFSSNLTIRFPIFSLTSIVMPANSRAERILEDRSGRSQLTKIVPQLLDFPLHGAAHILRGAGVPFYFCSRRWCRLPSS